MNSARILILLASAAWFTAGTASARNTELPFIPTGELGDAPEGFIAMCKRDQALCALGGPGTLVPAKVVSAATAMREPTGATPSYSTYRLTVAPQAYLQGYEPAASAPLMDEAQLAHAIKHVNKQVNHAVIEMTDRDAMGVDEYWTRLGTSPHPVGDCEDIAIEKRIRLTEAGFPAARLFYAVAYVRGLGLHTILIARMADGDYVLDSLSPHIVKWQALTSYTWLRHQMPGQPMEWRRMDVSAEPRVYVSRQTPASVVPPQDTPALPASVS